MVLGDLSTEDLFHVWDVITENNYQLSVPYVARVIRIESLLDQEPGAAIVERTFDFGSLRPDPPAARGEDGGREREGSD